MLSEKSNWILCLLLCSDEQNVATIGYKVAHEAVSLFDSNKSLFKIDDVNAVALSINEALHSRVPTGCAMTEVNSGLKHLTHGDNCHN